METSGLLLIARGHEVTTGLLQRLLNYRGGVREPARVRLRAPR